MLILKYKKQLLGFLILLVGLAGSSVYGQDRKGVQVIITQSPKIIVEVVDVADNMCYGENKGAIDISAFGGYPPYKYHWIHGDTTQDVAGLKAGIYRVAVYDEFSCSDTVEVELKQPPLLKASIDGIRDIHCYGYNNGEVDISVEGGVPPYTYSWNTGALTQDLTGVNSGRFSVLITDNNNCQEITTADVEERPLIVRSVNDVTNILCNGDQTGTIDISISGGVPPYSYQWSNNETTEDLANLAAGSYDVTVLDSEGCTEVSTTKVMEPAPLDISFDELRNLRCYGDFGGAINIKVEGGRQPYVYNWSNGATSQDIAGIPAGNYNVNVADNNGCANSLDAEITEPTALTATLVSSKDVSYYGGQDGLIEIAVSGGITPYKYKWTNESENQNIENIESGNYAVRITDAIGCAKIMNVTINQPLALLVNVDDTKDILCNGDQTGEIMVTVMGGVVPYTYSWSNGATSQDISNIPAGIYELTVTDGNGHQQSVEATLSEPPAFNAEIISTTNILCNDAWTGAIDLGVEGGVEPYKYRWSTGYDNQDMNYIPSGEYSVRITDGNRCEENVTAVITQPEPLIVDFENIEHINCFGELTGSISISVQGGAGGYAFAWSNGATTQNLNGIGAGSYSVEITDANGCTQEISTEINEPEQLNVVESTYQDVDCFSSAAAFISLEVTGGVTPYQFEWNNGANTKDISNLVAGNYEVNITDANGCTNSLSKAIVQPTQLVRSLDDVTNILCFDDAKGAINISVSGGEQPYKYKWSNGDITQDIIDVKAGDYSVLIEDANGCIDSLNATISQNQDLIPTFEVTNILCNSEPTGGIDLTVTGGVEPYAYKWSTDGESQDLTQLVAGNYSSLITDAVGCFKSIDAQITEPPKFVASLESELNILCFGEETGNINVRVSGGVTPYNFIWSNEATTQNLMNIPAGDYSLVATDANNCVQNVNTSIEQPSEIVYEVSNIDNVLCFGENGGSVDVSISGGVGPYSYLWSNGSTTQDIEKVPAGNYSVDITDANGCSHALEATITQPVQLSLNIANLENILCYGELKGAIDLNVNGGVEPYTFSWSNGATTEDISDAPAGNYTVTVTDAQGCIQSINASILQPPPLQVQIMDEKHLACFGDSNGAIFVDVRGGVTPYTFDWSNGATTKNVENLVAGVYTVTIVDANGCSQELSTEITEPEKLVSSLTNSKDVSCFEGIDGEVNITVNGGTTPYQYNWSNGSEFQDLIGVVAGNYSVSIMDAKGCKDSIVNVAINQPTFLDVSLVSVTDILTYGKNTGVIDLAVSGGVAPYAYSWSNGVKTQDLSDAPGGNYSVKVVDSNGCEQTVKAMINQPPPMVVSLISVEDIPCFDDRLGNINISVEGGAPPYTYNWSNGAMSKDVLNVAAGNYSVTVTDANGNTGALSTKIAQPTQITPQFDIIENLQCFNDQSGSISLSVTGGVAPYKYAWSTGQTEQDLSGLAAGTYILSITDANSCVREIEAVVSQPDEFAASIARIGDINCNGSSEGGIELDVQGGVRPYSYLWSNGEKSKDIEGVLAGDYSVKLADANGCTNELNATISEPEPLVTELRSVSDNKCFEEETGTVEIDVRGGVQPYKFNWSNGDTVQNITNIAAGEYQVEITDANGCVGIVDATVNQPISLIAKVSEINNVSCFGETTGDISVDVVGGTSPYAYQWSNNETTQNLERVAAGNYSFSVKDAQGCVSKIEAEITQPELLTLELDNTQHILCNGDDTGFLDVDVNGGVYPYSYSWSNGTISEDLINALAGTYAVMVKDANGCIENLTTEINEPEELVVSLASQEDVECAKEATGLIDISAAGGVAPYSYKWNTGQMTNKIEGITAGKYIATVTDANGCNTLFTTKVTEPQILVKSVDAITDIRCYGEETGSINVTVMEGTGPYKFEWSNGETTEDIHGVVAGDYQLKVTEANGCVNILEATIEEPVDFITSVDNVQDVQCFGDEEGAIDISVAGGVTPYSFAWSNGMESQNISKVIADNYSVMIIDANGCIETLNAEITQPEMLALNIDSVYNVKCCGDKSGAIFISVNGGIEPYQYNWSNGASTQDIKDLELGVYTVLVSDANNCYVSSIDDMTLYEQVVSQGKFTTRDILFDVAKSVIKTESFTTINKIATFMKEHRDIAFSIEGHTDSDGTADSNQKLSEERAKSIRKALIKFGIRSSRVKAKGYGETRPIALNTTQEGKAQNRRVEFVVLSGTFEGTLIETEGSLQ